MCNIHVLVKRRNAEVTHFLNCVSAVSYDKNSDGDGLGGLDFCIKGERKQDYTLYREAINQNNILIAHQRLKTSGSNKDVQPFSSDRFVFAHNGVMSEYAKKTKSDTHRLFNRFEREYSLCEERTERKKMVKTVKKIFDKSEGTFSIAILDKQTNKLYYFKNATPRITFYTSKNFFYFTTSWSGCEFLNLLGEEFTERNIEDYKIYEFVGGEFLGYRIVGEIVEKPYTYNYDYKNKKRAGIVVEFEKTNSKTAIEELEQTERNRKINGRCCWCWKENGTYRDTMNIHDFLCDKCFREWADYDRTSYAQGRYYG